MDLREFRSSTSVSPSIRIEIIHNPLRSSNRVRVASQRGIPLVRDETSTIAVGTNLPFSEWGQIITDPRLVAAVIDRLTFNAHIIETGTDSYRLKTSRTNNS